MDEADKNVLNLNSITSTRNKEKKSEALLKISKRPPSAASINHNISVPNKNKNMNKNINNQQANKISDKNFFKNQNLPNKTETEKKLEKKISLLLSANTNNYTNSKLNKVSLKPNNSNGYQELASKKAIQNQTPSIGNNTTRLNLNNPRIVKNSFDLSIPSTCSINSSKSKTNSNRFLRSTNNTPVNTTDGKNVIYYLFINIKFICLKVHERKMSSIYSINPQIFQDKNILEFIRDFQINKGKNH